MDTSDLFGSLMGQLGGGGIEQIGRSVGLDSGDVSKVLAGAMPAMLSGLTRNSSSSAGAAGLLGALDRDHDGSVLDDVMGFLGGGGNLGAGAGILGHVLGGRQSNVESAISKSSGVDMASVGKILAMVAPLLMGALGKAKREQGLDAAGLTAALGQQEQAARKVSPSAVDMFSRMLDSDGDGDTMDDIVKMGSGLLGGLFKS
ncbi:MAG: DUF937 domain-containing protein [Acidobacteriota bacterium]|nr:DUF937 domain-containing protein [Acidobacteriota bacterium]